MASSAEVGLGVAVEPAAPAPAPSDRADGRARLPPPPRLLAVFALAVAAVFASPLLYLAVRSAALGGELVATVLSGRVGGPLARSLLLAGTVSGAAAVVGTGLAWLVVRTDLPLRRLWRVLAPLPLVIPSFVGAAALLAAFAPGGLVHRVLGPLGLAAPPRLQGFWAAFAVLTLLTYPYVYLPVAARLVGLSPSPEEGARLLGRRPAAVFATVVLPQVSAAVWAGTLLVFLYNLSEFGAVVLLRYDTLTRAIYALRLADTRTALALSLVLAVLALVVVGADRRVARRRPLAAGARTRRPVVAPLGRWRLPALAAVALVVGLALVAPLAVLAYWAARGWASGALPSVAGELAGLAGPAVATALVAVTAAAASVAAVLPVAWVTVRHRGPVGGLANAAVIGGFALPGLVTALALGFLALQAPAALGLYQSLALLLVAYVVHFGVQALRAAQVAVAGVPRPVADAARVLGAPPWRRVRTVELPLMRPALLAGGGLVLLSTMKELPATLLLRPLWVDTVAVEIWKAAEDGFLAEVGVASLLLVALSGLLTWLLVLRRGERGLIRGPDG